MFSPTIAMKYVPICAPLMSPTLSQCGATRMNATLAAKASTAAMALASASLDTSHHLPAEDGADRALESADDRRRERVDQDGPHHVRVERGRSRSGEEPRDGADR